MEGKEMTDAPKRIWVAPPYFTVSGEVPDITFEANWDGDAQSFKDKMPSTIEYHHNDTVKALRTRIMELETALWTIGRETFDEDTREFTTQFIPTPPKETS